MLTARHQRIGLFAALCAGGMLLIVGVAMLVMRPAPDVAPLLVAEAETAPQSALRTPEPAAIDATTTGAIAPLADVPPDLLPPVTTPFQTALALIKEGDAVGAYAAATALADPLERRVGQWAAIYFGGGDVPLADVEAFSAAAPDFTVGPVFRTRFEQALIRTRPIDADIVAKLGGSMPKTLTGQILLAKAYAADGQSKRAAGIARGIWVGSFLDKDTEQKVLTGLGDLLTPKDHWDRAVYLMMHDRATAAERLSKFLTPAQQSLMAARNATSRRDKDAKALLDKVDPSMTDHPLYLFSRAQRAEQAGLLESAVDWLGKQTSEPPEAAEWWYFRRDLVRELLAQGDVKLAYRAADEYRHGPDGRLVEAHFHAGWIALSFLKDAKAAVTHFTAMAAHSTLSDSVTQANYWLARALRAAGDGDAAEVALQVAASHPTVYYGLLARAELGETGAELRTMPDWRPVAPAFEERDLVKAIRLLIGAGEPDRALPLLRGLYPSLKDGAELLLAARLAQELDAHNLAITIADVAEQRGTPLDIYNFPRDALPASYDLASIDKAAVFAITRQESRFQTDAVSSSGARGLMQLMPATARETAGKLGLDYSPERLTSDPEYNALLGSAYLKAQLERFDGSLVLAAAAYNAGATNADKWIAAYGDPRSDKVDPVLWVELIPFQETRLYVKRVLGNYMVYRAREGDTSMTLHQALRQIPH